MQQPHLPPNPGPFPPVGMPHLSTPKGLPGLPIALGGTAAVTRPNGLHQPMMLPTPPPLVSVPHSSIPPHIGALPPGSLPPGVLPPGILPPGVPPSLMVPPHRIPQTASMSNARSSVAMSTIGANHSSVPASLDTSTLSTPSSTLPASSVDSFDNRSALIRSRSPDRQRESPPSAKRARSRSPLNVTEDSDSDIEPDNRSPEPEASILDKECHRTKNAIFLRHLSRGWNSCSRCDIQFRPTPESKLTRSRDDKIKTLSQSEAPKIKEEEKSMKSESPPRRTFFPPSSPHLQGFGRLSPGCRPPYGLGVQDPTPALRQLSEYARPHVLGEPPRSLPYSVSALQANPLDPYYRMAAMYPPGSRERLELELDREKRERDAREREMREKDLRDMELREKMKHEIEMKPPAGFERFLPPGANPMDPYWTELLKRYAAIPPTGVHAQAGGPPGATPPAAHHPSQLPGIYPPAHLSNDLIRAERERMERLGEAARAASSDPLRNANLAYYEYFQRVSYEQIVLHRQALAQATGSKSPEPADPRMAEYARLAQTFARADPLSAGGAGGGGLPPSLGYPPIPPAHSLPPGHPLLEAARQQELLYRDLITRSHYGADPALTQHLLAQQADAARIAMERERLAAAQNASVSRASHMH